jgi:hypothetical protein
VSIFSRSQRPAPTASQQPECTAAAVADLLAGVGFSMSEPCGPGAGDRTAGLYAADLPLSVPRVAVYSYPRFTDMLAGVVAGYLTESGYQAELIADHPSDYLVAWTEGDS